MDTDLAPGSFDVHDWEARTLVDDRIAGRVRELVPVTRPAATPRLNAAMLIGEGVS